MAKPKRPLVLVQTNPEEIGKGQLLTISARLFDPNTNQPMKVNRIFMSIISKNDGQIVWPLEVIRKNTDRFDIQIGTDAMKEGHEYFLRVSNNWNLSPNGAATFKIRKDSTKAILLAPLAIPTAIGLEGLLKQFLEKKQTALELDNILRLKFPELSDKNIEELKELILDRARGERQPVDNLVRREIDHFKFITQMDHRVCPICKPFENQIFRLNEDKPKIPLHINCRCTYDVVFIEAFDPLREPSEQFASVQQFEASFTEVIEVMAVAKQGRRMLKGIKAVEIVDNVS